MPDEPRKNILRTQAKMCYEKLVRYNAFSIMPIVKNFIKERGEKSASHDIINGKQNKR